MNICPVCGFKFLKQPPYSIYGSPSDEICSCCGFQFGFDDFDQEVSHEEYRNKWIKDGCVWFTPSIKPNDWDSNKQLERLTRLEVLIKEQLDELFSDRWSIYENISPLLLIIKVNGQYLWVGINDEEVSMGLSIDHIVMELLNCKSIDELFSKNVDNRNELIISEIENQFLIWGTNTISLKVVSNKKNAVDIIKGKRI